MDIEVTLRPASWDDGAFCIQVHEASMRPVIEQLFGPWDPEVQQGFHDRWFDPESVRIIEADGEPVGVLGADDCEGGTYVSRIEVFPEWQDRGIGTEVITGLLAEAAATGSGVALHVFPTNRARAFYERLGFTAVEETEGRILMRATPR